MFYIAARFSRLRAAARYSLLAAASSNVMLAPNGLI